jgi:hypothetical protein
MIIAVEDALSEAIVRKLVCELRPDLTVEAVVGGRGRGYIEGKAAELNRTASNVPVLVLADLDRPQPCPADFIERSLGQRPVPGMLFRLAVMEIESWVLADREELAAFLGVATHRIPAFPDAVLHPKEMIVDLARRSRFKAIRQDLVPAPGGTAVVGPAFNARLLEFVVKRWNQDRAKRASPSLRRMVERLVTAFR